MGHQAPLIFAMRVAIKLFAILRDRAGVSDLSLELPDGSTVADAAAELRRRFPQLEKFLARSAFALNQSYVQPDAKVRDGDELAIIPPVSGGYA
jgi:molybdopterin converting factor subunit 1